MAQAFAGTYGIFADKGGCVSTYENGGAYDEGDIRWMVET